MSIELFELSSSGGSWDDESWSEVCECGEDVSAKLEIDAGDLSISCSTCGKSLLHENDLVYMEPIPVDVECIQEHDHHWDTYGCDCDFYWELKTRTPKE
jgi:hypothetical protein